MTGIHSKHDNGKEDRLWDFQQSKLLPSTSPVQSGYVNNWDGEFSYFDDLKVFVGMYSVHDNGKEDRRFKIYQSSHGMTASSCHWSGTTDWDAEWTLEADSPSMAITGMWSKHDNGKEDRVFRFRFCKISVEQGSTWTGWVNNWDGPVDWQTSNGNVMTGVTSKHDNSKEDRLWSFRQTPMLASTSPVLSNYVNNWDAEFSYYDDSKVFVGMYSVHDNGKEDRKFKFHQSVHGMTASSCYWTSKTDWDAEWTVQGEVGEAITGVWAKHDNGKEDRKFQWRFCKIAP